jgi:hypothetical protein
MALKKVLPTDFGMDAEYWRITNINCNFQGTTTVILDGYLNKDARFDNAQPLRRHIIDLPLQDVTRAIAYAEFKKSEIVDGVEQNIFAESLDV